MKRNVVRNELAWCIFLYWVKWGVLFVGDGVAYFATMELKLFL